MAATTSLLQIFGDIRAFFLGAFQNLPLALAGTLLFLGLMTANYGMLFMALGLLIIVPAVVLPLNFLADLLSNVVPMDWFKTNSSELCDLIVSFSADATSPSTQITISTYWTAMTVFFLAYILTNSIYLYTAPVNIPKDASDALKQSLQNKASLRISQAILAMIMVVLFGIVIFAVRLRVGCESIPSLLITTAIFSSIGYAWYQFLASIGNNRLSDLFGIANRLLSPQAYGDTPLACLPVCT